MLCAHIFKGCLVYKLKYFLLALFLTVTLKSPLLAADLQAGSDLIDAAEADLIDNNDCASAMNRLTPLIEAVEYDSLPDRQKIKALDVAVWCAQKLRQSGRAYSYAKKATLLPNSSSSFWNTRLALELDQKRTAEGLATFEMLASRSRSQLNEIPIRTVRTLHWQLQELNESAPSIRFLRIVTAPTYAPANPFFSKDNFFSDFASLLLADGKQSEATEALLKLRDPSAMLRVILDPALNKVLPKKKLRDAAESDLLRTQSMLEQHPNWLAGHIEVARLQRMLGRPEMAIKIFEEVLEKIEQPGVFIDLSLRQNWFWNDLGKTFVSLGRYEEALLAYQEGSTKFENGRPNVSQLINLAHLQFVFGRFDDSLKTLDTISSTKLDISPFGEMVVRYNKGCIFYRQGKLKEAEDIFAYVSTHQGDNPLVHFGLSVCMDRIDEAAASLVQQLNSPKNRQSALLLLMDYDDPPAKAPSDEYLNQRYDKVAKHDDVRAALARYGGAKRINLQESELN